MNAEEFARLEQMFMGIRDERGVHRNTAVRIGTAFLELLRYASTGEFDEISFNTVLNKPTFLQGLITMGSIVFGAYAEGLQGGVITEEGVAELKELWVRESATLGDGTIHRDQAGSVIPALQVRGDSTFTGDLSSPDFVSAFLGGLGWAIQKQEVTNAAGEIETKYTLEIDNVTVRNTLRVFELVVSQLMGENDNRVFTSMLEVHHYDPETGKIWLSTNGGRFYNPFRAGDCVMVQQYQADNDISSGGDGYITKTYEMVIADAGTGGATDESGDRLDWVTFENFTTTMVDDQDVALTPVDLIAQGDALTRVDSITDPDRKGIITIMSVGDNTPYMDVIYGLKTDPNNAVKGRIGNLEGIQTDDFGQLEGFGAYVNNFYGTGIFRNAQTGERLSARITATAAQLTQLYRETTYDITEDENLVSNGFFVREMEDWEPCTVSGGTPSSQGKAGTLFSGGMPLMVNGKLVAVSNREQSGIMEYEGVPMLHLCGMGVAQDFSAMTANSTHKEMESESGTTMVDVADDLFMGIRILPITTGTLQVSFVPESGSQSGWSSEIDTIQEWMLIQSADNAQNRWDFTGNGRMIISYTGECLIRFVALTNDPVSSSKVEFSTRITQTSRLIKAEADAVYATRTMHSELSLQVGQIATEVTNNKSASDTAKAQIESRLGTIEAFDENTATWMTQTDNRFSFWASNFDANGKVKDLAQLRIDVNAINTTIGTLATTAAMTSYVNSLQSQINDVQDDADSNATAISQTKSTLNLIAASFNSDGSVKTSGNIGIYIANEYSFIDVEADYINFSFTKEWRVYSGDTQVMGINADGDVWFKGKITSGSNITGDVIVNNDVKFYVSSTKYAKFASTDDQLPMLYIRNDDCRGLTITSLTTSANGLYVHTPNGLAIRANGACTFAVGDGNLFQIINGYFAPQCAVKTSSFPLPSSPTTGTIFFCKGVTSDLTVTTTDLPIQAPDSKSSYVSTYSSHNFGDDAFILICTGGYWAWFRCD